jgi:hypothetical protein
MSKFLKNKKRDPKIKGLFVEGAEKLTGKVGVSASPADCLYDSK